MSFCKFKISNIFLFLMFILMAGCLSIALKQDFIWDLINYHYYNAWAFVHHRLGYDIAPAFVNTYFNPLIELPYYFMVQYWNEIPDLIMFCQGTWFGILMFIFYKICLFYFDTSKECLSFVLTLLLAATGFATFSQIGTSTNEIQVSVLILWGFYLILKHLDDIKRTKIVWVTSGLLMGLALGLKPTVIPYCIAMGISLIIFMKPLNVSIKEISIFALSGLIGYLLVNGWWMWQLYEHFDNPFFPFLNKIFKSEYFDDMNFSDRRYIDIVWWKKLILPYLFAFHQKRRVVGETVFFDFRFALVYTIILFQIAYYIIKNHKMTLDRRYLLAYAFGIIAYLLWLSIFSILRYAIVLELLIAIVIVKFFVKIKFSNVYTQAVWQSVIVVSLFILLTNNFLQNYRWGSVEVADRYIDIEKIDIPEDFAVKLYGIPIAMVGSLIVDEKRTRILGFAHMNMVAMQGSDFAERGKTEKLRRSFENSYKEKNIAVFNEISYLPQRTVSPLDKKSKYCRKLHFNLSNDFVICVPEEQKYQILLEEDKYGQK